MNLTTKIVGDILARKDEILANSARLQRRTYLFELGDRISLTFSPGLLAESLADLIDTIEIKASLPDVDGDVILDSDAISMLLNSYKPSVARYEKSARRSGISSAKVLELIQEQEITTFKDTVALLKSLEIPDDDRSYPVLPVIPTTALSSWVNESALVLPVTDTLPDSVKDQRLYPGLSLLVGQTGAGKTTVTSRSDVDCIVRVSEPSESIDNDDRSLAVESFEDAINHSLILSSLGLKVIIDSGRQLMYSLGGSAMSKGVSGRLFDAITNLNNIFALVMSHATLTLNPVMESDDDADDLAWRLSSSCAGAIFLRERPGVNTRVEWVSYRLLPIEGGINDRVHSRSKAISTVAGVEAIYDPFVETRDITLPTIEDDTATVNMVAADSSATLMGANNPFGDKVTAVRTFNLSN